MMLIAVKAVGQSSPLYLPLMKTYTRCAGFFLAFLIAVTTGAEASADNLDPRIRYAGSPAELAFYRISEQTFEVVLTPTAADGQPIDESAADYMAAYDRDSLWSGRSIMDPVRGDIGKVTIELLRSPLRVVFRDREEGEIIQQFSWEDGDESGVMEFYTDAPVFGLHQVGPFVDMRGTTRLVSMLKIDTPLSSSGAVSPVLFSADGWLMHIIVPEEGTQEFDLTGERGRYIPDPDYLDSPLRFFVTILAD